MNFKILDPEMLQWARGLFLLTMREEITASERVKQDGNDALTSTSRSVGTKLHQNKTFQRFHPSEFREPVSFNSFFDSLLRLLLRKELLE